MDKLTIAEEAYKNGYEKGLKDAVKHGRWLYDSGAERYFCSECREYALSTSKDEPVYDYDWEENLRYSHTETIYEEYLTDCCPNCGAMMDGGAEDG